MIFYRILNTEKSNKSINKIECHIQVEECLIIYDPASAVVLGAYEAERRRTVQTDAIVHYPTNSVENCSNSYDKDYFVDTCAQLTLIVRDP